MATLSITIPDAMVPAVFDALVWKYPKVDITGLAMGAAARKIIRHVLVEAYKEHRVTLDNTTLLANYNALLASAKAAADTDAGQITA